MMKMYKLLGALAITAVLGSEIKAQTTYSWSPAGPVLSAGRSRNMVVDRLNSNVLYVGSVSSGIFKSTNSGAQWAPLNDQDTVRNISYLAQASDNTIYAATGEGFLRFTARSRALKGTGLYKLVGSNLIQVKDASVTGNVITRIACHPTDPNKLAIAGNNGLLISSDGGSSFSTPALGSLTTPTALTVTYDQNGFIYATATDDPSGGGVKVFKSTDNGATFSDITPTSTQLPNSIYGRIELGIAPSNANVIYASVAKPTSPSSNGSTASLYGFFVSKDGGATWILILEGSPQLDPLSSGGSSCAGDYAHCVIVNPTNPDQVYVGSFSFYQWTKATSGPEGYGNWLKFGNSSAFDTPFYLRQNIHDVKLVGGAFYFVTDAGVYKSSDNLLTFQLFSNGLGTAQYNNIAITRFPKTSNVSNSLVPYSGFLAGTAGNGISYFSGNYPAVTTELNYLNGDFFTTEFSRLSPKTAFFTTANSNIYVASDITANEPTLLQVSHLGSQCGSAPSLTSIDFRGISNGGSTTDDTYANNSFTTVGTPFKLWENYGANSTIDSTIFFNDSVRVLIPVTSTVGATTSYTVSLIKPQFSAIIDKVNIRTFTVAINTATSTSCFANSSSSYTLNYKATMEFGGATTPTSLPSSYTLTGLTSTAVNTSNNLSINAIDHKDIITFELPINPLSVVTNSNNYQYVRVGVTVFYRYKAGNKIIVENKNISNSPFKDSLTLASDINWTYNNVGTNSLSPVSTDAPIKFKMPMNSRLAILNDKGVLVSKRPLNTNDPQKFQIVSCTGALTTNSSTYTAGQMTVSGTPYLLEWAPNGKAIYYVTSATTPTPTYRVYKVNVGTSIYDFAIEDYRGAYYTGCVKGTRTGTSTFTFATNFSSKFRTTLIGTFSERITNLSVSDNSKTLLLTTSDVSSAGKRIYVSTPNIDTDNIDNTVVTFSDKTGDLPKIGVYCSLFEMSDNKRVLIGTDKGVYRTEDITAGSPTWIDEKKSPASPVNNYTIANVQVYDIKQQKMTSWDSYNSGIIYVATNGRGAWVNKNFLTKTVIGVQEHEMIAKNTGLSIYPNPTNGNVTVNFFAANNEDVVVNILDINGRLIKSESVKNLSSGYTDYNFNTSDMNNGVYIVNISSSLGIKRVSKLIVSK